MFGRILSPRYASCRKYSTTNQRIEGLSVIKYGWPGHVYSPPMKEMFPTNNTINHSLLKQINFKSVIDHSKLFIEHEKQSEELKLRYTVFPLCSGYNGVDSRPIFQNYDKFMTNVFWLRGADRKLVIRSADNPEEFQIVNLSQGLTVLSYRCNYKVHYTMCIPYTDLYSHMTRFLPDHQRKWNVEWNMYWLEDMIPFMEKRSPELYNEYVKSLKPSLIYSVSE